MGLNVRDFGAVGDGVADDTDAVARALEAAQAGGGPVEFPEGSYRVTGSLPLPGQCNIEGADKPPRQPDDGEKPE